MIPNVSNSIYNKQLIQDLESTNLNQILDQEKQNDANYLALSETNI